ncbi:MAG: polysaccharide deacetylase family protein [Gemmatimonadales bacterium]
MAGESSRRIGSPTVNVLMYHSIANGVGPTAIPAAVFAEQMAVLGRSGCAVVTLGQVVAWMRGEGTIPERAVAITFDDGFADFIPAAKILAAHGFPATVFLVTGCMGGHETWRGAFDPPRAIMRWADARSMLADGIEFGGHTITHPSLPAIDPDQLVHEIVGSRDAMEAELGARPSAFAAPYGAVNNAVRAEIAKAFDYAVGTTLDRALQGGSVHDMPRIDMHYFRDAARWEAFLAGRGELRLVARQALRAVRRWLR